MFEMLLIAQSFLLGLLRWNVSICFLWNYHHSSSRICYMSSIISSLHVNFIKAKWCLWVPFAELIFFLLLLGFAAAGFYAHLELPSLFDIFHFPHHRHWLVIRIFITHCGHVDIYLLLAVILNLVPELNIH